MPMDSTIPENWFHYFKYEIIAAYSADLKMYKEVWNHGDVCQLVAHKPSPPLESL
jgi:hypothetical protein